MTFIYKARGQCEEQKQDIGKTKENYGNLNYNSGQGVLKYICECHQLLLGLTLGLPVPPLIKRTNIVNTVGSSERSVWRELC